MDTPAFSFDDDKGLELRVLDGAQAGARAPLSAAAPCVIAAGPEAHDADVLLRDGDTVRVRITLGGGQALIEVLQGSATLGDAALESGQAALWLPHAPLRLGSSVVAYGRADEETWPDDAAAEEPIAATPDDAPPQRARAPWAVTLGITLALGSAALLGLVHVVSAQGPAPAPEPTLATALQGSEFSTLTLVPDAAGRVELRGRLSTLAQRTQLDTWLAARQFTPVVQVQVDEAVARDVVDVFRVNGVSVQARVQGAGRVLAEATEPDAERLKRAEDVVRRDVRGLEALSVVNRATPQPPPAPPVPDDPGKRIASLVPGEPAYLVTADGSRYFIGAMLPSGHRITHIATQRVTLERDGHTTNLNL